MGYHTQTSNKDDFLSFDFGLKEFGIVDSEERLKRYRRYVYEAGALDRSGKPDAGVIDASVLEKERKDDFELKRVQRFGYRLRSISFLPIPCASYQCAIKVGTKLHFNNNAHLLLLINVLVRPVLSKLTAYSTEHGETN